MIDLHAHILTDTDDGASSFEESVALLYEARKAGFTGIVCTPHYMQGFYEKDANYINPHKGCIMLMAAEGNNKNNFEPIEHYYHSLLEHLGWKNLGEIYAGGVMGIGDIKGHPALEDVKKLALSI